MRVNSKKKIDVHKRWVNDEGNMSGWLVNAYLSSESVKGYWWWLLWLYRGIETDEMTHPATELVRMRVFLLEVSEEKTMSQREDESVVSIKGASVPEEVSVATGWWPVSVTGAGDDDHLTCAGCWMVKLRTGKRASRGAIRVPFRLSPVFLVVSRFIW